MAILSVRNVYKSFAPGTFAVQDVSFELEKGECLGIAGESGSGKSTLIRMLARLTDTSPGPDGMDDSVIRLHGEDINLLPGNVFAKHPLRSKIQMVFQDPTSSLNPCFSAERSIADPLKTLLHMKESKEIAQRVRELAALVQLPEELLLRLPHQLSGGQKARVGIARALASNPSVVLLDEPTTALDVSVQGQVLCLLDDLKRQLGISFIFVSHDLSVLRLLCDSLLVMQQGQVVERGKTSAVFANPQHPYTKALVASIPTMTEKTLRPCTLTKETQPSVINTVPSTTAPCPENTHVA